MIDCALDRGRMPFMDTILASVVARFSDELLIVATAVGPCCAPQWAKSFHGKLSDGRRLDPPFSIGEWFRGPYRNLFRDAGARRSSLAGIISRPQLRTL